VGHYAVAVRISAAQLGVAASKLQAPLVVPPARAVVTILHFVLAAQVAQRCRVDQPLVELQPEHPQEIGLLSRECGSDAGWVPGLDQLESAFPPPALSQPVAPAC
jgi:hypothetical protein